jgi:hypothetical protein
LRRRGATAPPLPALGTASTGGSERRGGGSGLGGARAIEEGHDGGGFGVAVGIEEDHGIGGADLFGGEAAVGEFLGNFPQAFTHIGLINSAIYLAYAERHGAAECPLVGTKEHAAAEEAPCEMQEDGGD